MAGVLRTPTRKIQKQSHTTVILTQTPLKEPLLPLQGPLPTIEAPTSPTRLPTFRNSPIMLNLHICIYIYTCIHLYMGYGNRVLIVLEATIPLTRGSGQGPWIAHRPATHHDLQACNMLIEKLHISAIGVHRHTSSHEDMCVYTYYTSIQKYTQLWYGILKHVRTYNYTYSYMHVKIYTYLYEHVHMYARLHMSKCLTLCVYIYVYVYATALDPELFGGVCLQ